MKRSQAELEGLARRSPARSPTGPVSAVASGETGPIPGQLPIRKTLCDNRLPVVRAVRLESCTLGRYRLACDFPDTPRILF